MRRSQTLLLAAAPARALLPCSQTRGRFSTSLAPAQRKRSGSLPGSPDMGGGVGGGRRDHSFLVHVPGPPCPLWSRGLLPAQPQLSEVQPGSLILCGCPGHQRRSFPTVCKHAGCWVLGQDCSGPSTAGLEAGSVGTRKQDRPPGLPRPLPLPAQLQGAPRERSVERPPEAKPPPATPQSAPACLAAGIRRPLKQVTVGVQGWSWVPRYPTQADQFSQILTLL